MADNALLISQIRQRLEILYQMVEELETGGGGGGGTDDYTQLSNKPQINGHTLTGNKTGSDLGLASAAALADKADKSTTYTKTQVDGLLDDKADKSTTYTKTEVDTALAGKANAATTYTKTETDAEIASEIAGAILDLDATSVGGSTKVITTISQANGIIDATAADTDITPTANSDRLVRSGGVKTYVDNAVATKASITDVYGPGIAIPDGADLNSDTYKVPGVYYRKSTSTTEYVSNTPVVSNYFKIIVEWVYPDYRLRQTFISLNRSCTYYMRIYDSGGWQAWHIFKNSEDTVSDILGQGTQLSPTSSNHIDLNDYLTEDKVGVYYTSNSTATGNLDNCPYTGASIRLEITKTGGYINQTIYVNVPSNQKIFRRTAVIGGTVGNWFVFDGTEIIPANAQTTNLGDEMRSVASLEESDIEPIEEPQEER